MNFYKNQIEVLYICPMNFNIKNKYIKKMEKYSEETINTVNDIVSTNDIKIMVKHAIAYISAYQDDIIDYVLGNIPDSEELYHDERKYLKEEIVRIINELV